MTKTTASPPLKIKRKGKRNGPPAKEKMTKEVRRAKYTALARQRRDVKMQKERSRTLVCFSCRERGHAASQCPNNDTVSDNKLCYKCGSTEHGLSSCPKVKHGEKVVEMDLPFATCFVCGDKGHLASQCERNEKGVYVNGGACRTCGSTKHRAVDCPDKEGSKPPSQEAKTDDDDDNDAFLEGHGDQQPEPTKETLKAKAKKRRVVKF